MRRAAFTGRDSADYVRSVLDHLFGVERSLFTGQTLHYQTRVLINEQEWQQSARQSFYLFDPRATRCTRADIDRFLGEPKQVVSLVGERQLLLYDYDILRRMSAQ